MSTPAIFLDRDGVINRNCPDHVKSWDEFEFLPGALGALQRLAETGLPVIVISNQGAIGRGLVAQETVEEINRRMVAEIRSAGGRVDDVFYCPHHPHDGCTCRKPGPGLLLQAADRWDLDLTRSVLIGDAVSDMVAAERAGCRSLLVLTGRGRDQLAALHAAGKNGFEVATDLPAAVGRICSEMQPAVTDP